jgi:hypothetical protein
MASNARQTIDPGKPHAFVPHVDAGIGAVASGGMGQVRGGVPTSLAVTWAYLREGDRCALPGCGRPRDDDRHSIPD